MQDIIWHQSGSPATKAAKLEIMKQGRHMSRTKLARDLPAQANPGAKLQLVHL